MAKRAKTIDLLRVVNLLQEHITPALCRAVFGAVRRTERQRVWTLEALIRFWTAVVLRAPKALSHALVDSLEEREPTYPRIEASPEAFVPPRYAAEMAPVRARCTAIVILDGSRWAAIAHRLKRLWNERAVVLPGCLLGVSDLGRGLCRQLTFCADAAAREMTRANAMGAGLPRGTLVLGDRLSGTADFFAALAHPRCGGVVRRHRLLSLPKLQRLRKRRIHGGRLEDWMVRVGDAIDDLRKEMATKADLKHFAIKDDMKASEVRILQAVDKTMRQISREPVDPGTVKDEPAALGRARRLSIDPT